MASDRFQRRIERLLDEADEAISRFDWEKVRQCAHAVLAIEPDNSDGLKFLATAERAIIDPVSSTTGSHPSSPPPATTVAATTQPNSPSAELRTSFANGRYQVQKFLGEGGKKKVYLAHDTLLDREVALALIKTEGLDDASRTRIQREAKFSPLLLPLQCFRPTQG